MPKIILLLFVSLFALNAQAQTAVVPAAAPPEISAGRRDTLKALANLYERRRNGGHKWLYVGLGGSLAFVRALTAGSTDTSTPAGTVRQSPDGGALALIFGTFVGIPAAIGFGKMTRFSEEKEDETDRAYRSGKPLPKSTSRRLAKKDF